jgi:hypothetical protein
MPVSFYQDRQNLAAYARYIQLEQLWRQDALEEASDVLVFQCVENARDQAADGFGDCALFAGPASHSASAFAVSCSFSFPTMFSGVRKFS